MTNRIGDSCWWKHGKESLWCSGILHAWSTDYIEFENGPGQFPVGVIEDKILNTCHSVDIRYICFSELPPK